MGTLRPQTLSKQVTSSLLEANTCTQTSFFSVVTRLILQAKDFYRHSYKIWVIEIDMKLPSCMLYLTSLQINDPFDRNSSRWSEHTVLSSFVDNVVLQLFLRKSSVRTAFLSWQRKQIFLRIAREHSRKYLLDYSRRPSNRLGGVRKCFVFTQSIPYWT